MMSNDMLQQNNKIVRLAHNFNLENKLEYKLKTITKDLLLVLLLIEVID